MLCLYQLMYTNSCFTVAHRLCRTDVSLQASSVEKEKSAQLTLVLRLKPSAWWWRKIAGDGLDMVNVKMMMIRCENSVEIREPWQLANYFEKELVFSGFYCI